MQPMAGGTQARPGHNLRLEYQPSADRDGTKPRKSSYLRRNRVQSEIAEACGVSQPTISRAISAVTPLLIKALSDFVPLADELVDGTYYIIDGTLLPCWSWQAHPQCQRL
jgi:hypothetical protein